LNNFPATMLQQSEIYLSVFCIVVSGA